MKTDARLNREGFTLIEILVVVIIMAILASIVGVNVFNKAGQARVAAAKTQMNALRHAVQLYKTEQGRYPTQEQGLEALVTPATTEPRPGAFPQGGYLDKPVLPPDPWGGEYIYLLPGRRGEPFEIICYGSDGEPGGDENDSDLSSSDP